MMMGTRSLALALTLKTRLGEWVPRGFGAAEAEGVEGLFVVVKDALMVDALVVDASEGCLRSAERLPKEKVDASECRIEALRLRGSVIGMEVWRSTEGAARKGARKGRGRARTSKEKRGKAWWIS